MQTVVDSKFVRLRLVSRVLFVALVAASFMILASGIAFANYGPHGNFETDTDACAGCHRAHTSVSNVTWTDNDGASKSALLAGLNVTSQGFVSATVKDFCYTCHGAGAAGAATDVQSGQLDATVGASTTGAVLNGGGFEDMGGAGATITSMHDMPAATAANPVVYGGGIAFGGKDKNGAYTGGGIYIAMDCSSCHDPHGSSNYRLLKDSINDTETGGYVGDFASDVNPDPKPFVVSNEVGYPTEGFRLHTQYPDYQPDYTTARYAKAPESTSTPGSIDGRKGLSGWCAACHTEYNTVSASGQAAYDAGDGLGNVTRHRHPVNVPLSNFKGDRTLLVDATDSAGMNTPWGDDVDLPLEHAITEGKGSAQVNAMSDNLGCLTCHRAHGTDKTMAGYAAGVDPYGNAISFTPPSVNATSNSAILRANNRGVCERCHNK